MWSVLPSSAPVSTRYTPASITGPLNCLRIRADMGSRGLKATADATIELKQPVSR